jgi:putative transposase
MGWKPVALFLADMGVTKTHSRPYVSDDNPYSESQFKTLKHRGPRGQVFVRGVVKYRPEFPERFGSIEDSRTFGQTFFPWYNQEHHHSGIGLLTPEMVHYGLAGKVIEQRQQVLNLAYARTPERFVRACPKPQPQPTAVWINPPVIEPANAEIRL